MLGGLGVRLSPVVVGRADLLDLVERRWQAAAAGSGHLLLLAGEAGVGKSRLLREATVAVSAGAGSVIGAVANPSDVESAGGVLLDLASQARRTGDPATAGSADTLTGRLRSFSADRHGDLHHSRRLLVADLVDAVVAIATGAAPLLLTVEDLHWADELTLEVLGAVAPHLPGLRLLILASYRAEDAPAYLRAWRARLLNQRLVEEARVARLTRAETASLCAAISGELAPTALVDAVYERSDGIPLHVEELLATTVEPAGATPAVPETLAEAVLARAARLSVGARMVADAACVIGRSFDPDLLAAAGATEPTTVDAALRELAEHHLIRGDGDSRWDFRHALIRDALYADLPRTRRRELHRRVADAARATRASDAFLSDQYERAGRHGEAYRHARAAATEASRMSANREAVELLRRAQRTAPTAIPGPDRAALLVELATALAATDDNGAADMTFAEAHRLLREHGDESAAAALVPDWVAVRHLLGADLAQRTALLGDALDRSGPEPAPRGRLYAALSAACMLARHLDEAIDHGRTARGLLAGEQSTVNVDTTLGSVLVFAGRMDEGWRLLEDAIAVAVAQRSEAEAARAYRMLGSSASVLVEYERAGHWLREGIGYAERTQRWNDRHYMAAHLGHVLWATGEWEAAESEARRALADGRGGVTTRITALHVLGYIALGRGHADDAEARLVEARRLGEQMGELQRLSPALWGLAELSVHRGQNVEAVGWCERGYSASAEVADAAYLFPFVLTGTRARLALDDLSGARDWLDRCGRLLTRRAIPGTLPALDHATGLLELADGHAGKARDALLAARDGWHRRGRFWEGSQVLLDLARCATRSRRTGEAVSLVREARVRAERAGAGPLLDAAGSLPDATGEADDGPLTPRENEVARLVASGATNREIAGALHIAPKTVAAHVEHILTKLGASRRAEIAAWAATRSNSRQRTAPAARVGGSAPSYPDSLVVSRRMTSVPATLTSQSVSPGPEMTNGTATAES